MRRIVHRQAYSIFALIFVFLVCFESAFGSQRISVKCSSVQAMLADPKYCHERHVRVSGPISDLTLKDDYTRFYLSEGSEKLRVFNFGNPFVGVPIKDGDCVLVEGVYFFYETQIAAHSFKNEIRWDKVSSCPISLSDNKAPTPDWKRWLILGAVVLLLVLALAGRRFRTRGRYHRMGRDFEEYVIGLFPPAEWEIEDRSSDTTHTMGRRVTGDVSYDWIVKHRKTGRRFILQCKFRSRFFRDGIEWATAYQIRNYKDFQQRTGYEYSVCIGVGGCPKQPERLYLAPLKRLNSLFVWRKELEIFARDPRAFFTMDDNYELK